MHVSFYLNMKVSDHKCFRLPAVFNQQTGCVCVCVFAVFAVAALSSTCFVCIVCLLANGINTNGAAAKVMTFSRLGKKVRPGIFENTE